MLSEEIQKRNSIPISSSTSSSEYDDTIVHQVFNNLAIKSSDNTKTTSDKDDQISEALPKQKRKRIRKRKKKNEEPAKEIQTKIKCYGKDLVTPKSIDINLKGKHFKFDENGECVEMENNNKASKIVEDKPQINLNKNTKAKIIRAIEIDATEQDKSEMEEKRGENTPTEQEPDIIETECEPEGAAIKAPNLARFDEAFLDEIRPSLNIFPEIENLPSDSDIIAFKFMTLKSDGPVFTDHIGYVLGVIEQDIKIQVLAGKADLMEFLDYASDIIVLHREKMYDLKLISN